MDLQENIYEQVRETEYPSAGEVVGLGGLGIDIFLEVRSHFGSRPQCFALGLELKWPIRFTRQEAPVRARSWARFAIWLELVSRYLAWHSSLRPYFVRWWTMAIFSDGAISFHDLAAISFHDLAEAPEVSQAAVKVDGGS